MGDFVSLRVPRRVMGGLHRLKAKLMLKREEKVSDAEVVGELIAFAREREGEFVNPGGKDLAKYSGFIRGAKSDAANDVDAVLYGWKK